MTLDSSRFTLHFDFSFFNSSSVFLLRSFLALVTLYSALVTLLPALCTPDSSLFTLLLSAPVQTPGSLVDLPCLGSLGSGISLLHGHSLLLSAGLPSHASRTSLSLFVFTLLSDERTENRLHSALRREKPSLLVLSHSSSSSLLVLSPLHALASCLFSTKEPPTGLAPTPDRQFSQRKGSRASVHQHRLPL